MKRTIFVLPGFSAALVLLLTWVILTTRVNGAPATTIQALAVVYYDENTQIDQGLQWTIEAIDPVKTFENMTDRSLTMDTAGHPHLVYGQERLFYAWHDGSTWLFKLVDPTDGVGGFAALALDDNDLPHISYYDQTHGDLRYAHFDGSTWFTATVDSAGDVGQYTSIAVDANGHPHISYYDVSNTGLKYASFAGATWAIQPLDGAGEMGQYTSLALDGSGLPRIAYYGGTHLKYARYTGTDWQILTVDPADLVGKYASIALDDANRPHISYYDEANQDLKYASFDGAAWQKQAVDTEGATGAHTSLAFDSADRPYIAYFAPGAIKTAHYTGASWQFDSLPDFVSNQTAVSLALDSGDHATLAVAQIPELRVFAFDGADWQDELVDYAGDNGGYTDIALDNYGRPHISYCTTISTNLYDCDYLKTIAFDGLAWQVAFIDRGGYHSSLALDAAGNAHISYMNNDTMRYAHFDGAGWQVEAVDVLTSTIGYFMPTSLALDSSDLPHISYCGYNPYICGDLKYARFDGAQWITQTVDSAGIVGLFNSIALDAQDHPHISYYDGTQAQLKHAFFDGGAWLMESVDGGGYYTSLALDQSGHPQIIYFDSGELRFAAFDGYAWHTETAFSSGNGDSKNSLSIDSLGQPHFSYVDLHPPFGFRVSYAYKDGAGWHNETVDYFNSQNSPYYAAMALDTQDRAHISYGGISLMYAYQVPVPLSGVSIQGPEIIGAGQNITYTAITAPMNAFEPITLTWSNGASGPTAVYSWSQPGTYPISVTAQNTVSLVTSTITITVRTRYYLPIVHGPPLTGDLPGLVWDNDTGARIQGASVCVVNTGQCATTDANGSYYISDVPIGNQLVRASANGYYTEEHIVPIEAGYPAMDGSFSLIPLQQYGSVSGQVISAVTAQGIGGASVCLVSGSSCTTTDGSGNYTLSNVPTGAQTVRASAGGYTALDQTVGVTANQTSPLNFVLSPTLASGEMRIVLTWGVNPRDLDSHLWLPPNHPNHIFFAHTGNCTADPFACLDVDDRYSYGPETITIKQRFNGTYRYAVYKYAGDGPITASGAQVKVYDSTGLIANYTIPSSGNGDWWYVFDMDGNSGAITEYNTIVETSPGSY